MIVLRQRIQLLDWALANTKVNNASYGLTASVNDNFMGQVLNDPFTSDQQRERDQYELNDEDWYEVSFQAALGNSHVKLALHKDWMDKQGIGEEGSIYELNLPEQGIQGPSMITSIRHILPQKRPVDEDPDDDFEYRPVTGIFVHTSDDVWIVHFDNGDSLGVTSSHPVFSKTYNDWRSFGELQYRESVLSKNNDLYVVSKNKLRKTETVFNLEVKELHNFLITENGIVVHNNYFEEVKNFLYKTSKADRQAIIDNAWNAGYPLWFLRGRFIEELLGQTRYKDWLWTGAISSNFPSVDFFRQSSFGHNIAASIKSTITPDVNTWISNNISHLDDLVQGRIAGEFRQGTNFVPVDFVELHIYVPKANFSQTMESTWTQAIKASYPEIKVVISTVEKQVGL